MIVQLQKILRFTLPLILFGFVFLNAVFVAAQTEKPTVVVPPTPPIEKNKEKYKDSKTKKRIANESDTPAEKSIAVDAKVNISFCVSEGSVTVNGWDRNEIRAYVSNGSKIGFKILQKSKQTGSPIWVKILGFDPSKDTEADADECLSGDEIEIDVPRGATVNIKGTESETTVESVRKVSVDIVAGDIFLNDIAEGIYALTYQGGVTVGKSGGAISLVTTDGNIVAYDVGPNEVGDVFKARTNQGMITLQQIEHGQIDVGSTSGSIKFIGAFSSGGQYNFGTQTGSVLLILPLKSSCMINAFLGYGGQFNSEIELVTENISGTGAAKTLTGQIGSGEAKLTLKTYNGKIHIKKQ